MLFDDRSGSAVDKGSVFQLALDFSQLAFDLCNFLIQPFFLPCFVRRGNGKKISPSGVTATGLLAFGWYFRSNVISSAFNSRPMVGISAEIDFSFVRKIKRNFLLDGSLTSDRRLRPAWTVW